MDANGLRWEVTQHWPKIQAAVERPLRGETRHFADCLRGVADPMIIASDGLTSLGIALRADSTAWS